MPNKPKISFCTTCMNRAHHLMETLLVNINDNIGYENIEFALLNYNSQDNMESYVFDSCSYEIRHGIVKYFKTLEPKFFHMSHAKNSVAILSSGDIICNIDADNFTGKDFAQFVYESFSDNIDSYLAVPLNQYQIAGVLGRICVKRSDFLKVEGYDENMIGYGWEDIDFYNRLESIGLHRKNIINSQFLKAIDHSEVSRYINYEVNFYLEKVYVLFISPYKSKVFFLHSNFCFEQFDIFIDNVVYTEQDPGIDFNSLVKGNYSYEKNGILFNNVFFKIDNNKISRGRISFRLVEDISLFLCLKHKYSTIFNYNLLNYNKVNNIVKPNNGSFGQICLLNS